MAKDADYSVEALIERLHHPDQVVCLHAATVLGSMNENAEPAVPDLTEMLRRRRA